MLFSSVAFLFYFLPIFLLVYVCAPLRGRADGPPQGRNSVLLAASLFFYTWGELEYVVVLLASIAVNYGAGIAISAATSRGRRQAALAAGVAANLCCLGFFKYAGFFADILSLLFGGLHAAAAHFPIGISFFTFQAMSYLVDVYRRDARAERNPLQLATYIAMFPQLVAGPIVRFHDIQGELHQRSLGAGEFERGIRFFALGLAQKMLVANTLATPVDEIFALPSAHLTFELAWLGSVAYSLQIYFDFSGYSHMAIGLGLMLGFHLPKNFDHPYVAQSISEFWRRWHLTLSAWFRDYLYIPLGGNRRGPLVTYRNLMIVFLLCGLWHGAAWTFVAWGAYHGAFLVVERLGFSTALERTWRPLKHTYTLLVVSVGFVVFRAESLPHAGAYLSALAGLGLGHGVAHHLGMYLTPKVSIALAVGALGSSAFFPWLADRLWTTGGPRAPAATRLCVQVASLLGVALALLLSSMSLAAGTHNPFIYFRF